MLRLGRELDVSMVESCFVGVRECVPMVEEMATET